VLFIVNQACILNIKLVCYKTDIFWKMKYLFVILLMITSCTQRKELVRLVNSNNDGFNAFNLSLRSDSSYAKTELVFNATGKYAIIDSLVIFKSGPYEGGKMIFHRDSLGCMNEPLLIEGTRETAMRVLFDSMFCNNEATGEQR
jgi:hypothetical protein